MKKHTLITLLLTALVMAAAPGVSAADAKAPRQATHQATQQARVAGGATVPLVSSSKTPEQWSAMRPKFRELRPKTRSNTE